MLLRAPLLFVFAALLGGCDAAFVGRGEAPEEVGAVYSVLDARAGQQTVRLEAVRTEPDRPVVPPALTADLVDETTGTRTPGRIRLVALNDGTQASLADFAVAIEPAHTYRLDVRDPAGRTATARTTVPPARTMGVLAPRRDSLRITQGVLIEGLPGAPASVSLRYHFVITRTPGGLAGDTTSMVVGGSVGEPVSGGWRVAADPQRDAAELLARLGSPPIARVRLVRVTVEVTERSAEWAFAEARTGPHLRRLLGVFVSLGASHLTFVPAEEVVRAGGFRP